jgi:hypothetical protein
MKGLLFSLVLGLGLLASGCGVFDVYRDQQMPAPRWSETHGQQAAPPMPPDALALPPVSSPSAGQLPPYWYWADQQQQGFDRYLQQQWMYYYQNRQPPPLFPRQPICTSTLLGGQIITTCR